MAKKKKKSKQKSDGALSGADQLERWQQAHRLATEVDVTQLANTLQELLTRQLTTHIAGVKDGKTVTRWASGEITEIRNFEVEQRLRTAFEIAQILLSSEVPSTVRAWFIGLNPLLNDASPVEALGAGQLKEAITAAKAFGEVTVS
ncbi:MAG: XRE family transcriptional regulator [Nitrolancea sp.]